MDDGLLEDQEETSLVLKSLIYLDDVGVVK